MSEAEGSAVAPIAEEAPCGPDLEADPDHPYLSCVTQVQGQLPQRYFDYLFPESEEDRVRINFVKTVADLKALSLRSHDLRLLTLRARIEVLARNLAGFRETITVIADLLEAFWFDLHPRADDNGYDRRRIELDALDGTTVLLPLQYVPLCETRRSGAVTWRAWMFTQKTATPRAGEETPSATVILDALKDGDPAVITTTRDHLVALVAALTKIRAVWEERANEGPPLTKLLDLTRSILGLVDQARPAPPTLLERASSAISGMLGTTSSAAVPSSAPSLGIETSADAGEALAALAAYYGRAEPSSPVLPLIEQAMRLRGKSFFEALQVLVPTYAQEANYQIGAQWFFDLPVQRIVAAADGEAAWGTDGGGEELSGKTFAATTRPEALALLRQIGAFFRTSEPSSPIPLLLDRAHALAERDFLSLLRDVLPRSALRDTANE